MVAVLAGGPHSTVKDLARSLATEAISASFDTAFATKFRTVVKALANVSAKNPTGLHGFFAQGPKPLDCTVANHGNSTSGAWMRISKCRCALGRPTCMLEP